MLYLLYVSRKTKLFTCIISQVFLQKIALTLFVLPSVGCLLYPCRWAATRSASAAEVTRRLSRPKRERREWKRERPRAALPMTTKGLWKRMLNTQAWKESVRIIWAWAKPCNHCSTEGWMRSVRGAVRSSQRELPRKMLHPLCSAIRWATAYVVL